jgi:hypothetical protein
MTVMKNNNASPSASPSASAAERAAALVNQAIDVLRQADYAPASPLNTFTPAKLRRELRRNAKRLRQGNAQPRYKNLHTAEELAGIYEQTVRRDEILEQVFTAFKKISRELSRVLEENDPKLHETMLKIVTETYRSAVEQGPCSEAAHRFRLMEHLAWVGLHSHAQERRGRAPTPLPVPLAPDPSVEARYQMSAAEILDSPPPPGEAVIAIPPDGKDSGRGRLLIRIGVRKASWIGSFERGHKRVSMVLMMPDGEHLFVSAGGAGYVIHAKTRTLVEAFGTTIVGATRDETNTFLVVNHNDMSLEAFGRNGRLWKTGILSTGGFRQMGMAPGNLVGEARHPSRRRWTAFSLKLATGEVRWEDGG